MNGVLADWEAPYADADDALQVQRTCSKCGQSITETDRGFAILGWRLYRRTLRCPECLPRKYRGRA